MKKAIVPALLLAVTAGCATDGQLLRRAKDNGCGSTGVSYTPVTYGDSHLVVFSLTDVAPGSQWFIELAPMGDGLRNARVSVKAKSGGPAWLAVEGRRSDGPRLSICVPDTAPIGQEYDYLVEVENVGVLDPHVRVIER